MAFRPVQSAACAVWWAFSGCTSAPPEPPVRAESSEHAYTLERPTAALPPPTVRDDSFRRAASRSACSRAGQATRPPGRRTRACWTTWWSWALPTRAGRPLVADRRDRHRDRAPCHRDRRRRPADVAHGCCQRAAPAYFPPADARARRASLQHREQQLAGGPLRPYRLGPLVVELSPLRHALRAYRRWSRGRAVLHRQSAGQHRAAGREVARARAGRAQGVLGQAHLRERFAKRGGRDLLGRRRRGGHRGLLPAPRSCAP